MDFYAVTDTWTGLRATRSRKKKTALLVGLLNQASAESASTLVTVVTWLTGELPQGKIGVGPSMLRVVRDTAPGPGGLTVEAVHGQFDAMAAIAGKGSKARRETALRELLGAVSESSQTFLLGLLMGELRQGAVAGVMVAAISDVFEVPIAVTRRAAMLSGDLADVAVAAFRGGEEALRAFVVTPFTPLQPMLAHPAETTADVLVHVSEPSWETKLDGARVQVHKVGQAVRVFTRHLREITGAVPEVVEVVRSLDVERVILDGEAIALLASGRPRPFQETMRRIGRQGASLRHEIPLHVAFFDILLCGSDELIDLPYSERMARMDAVVPQANQVPRRVLGNRNQIDALFESVLDQGHEGLMGKDPQSIYAAGARGHGWFKLKNVWTLDLVVLAVEWGSGRRQGKLSNLHLGARDAETGEFVMLGKTFKGLTDAMLAWQTERFLELETHRSDWVVHVRPVQVVEVAFNDVQVSPKYPGGMALRFARVKGYRDDKSADQADTIGQVRAILQGAAD